MSKILTIDIGAGTLDLLYYDTQSAQHYKAVVKSPVKEFSERIRGIKGDIVITGVEMGGGELSSALIMKAREGKVFITPEAAATIHHSQEKLSALGFSLVEPKEAGKLKNRSGVVHLKTADIEPRKLKHLVEHLGVCFSFDVVGVCVQDHGVAPSGISHRDYRQSIFKPLLDKNPAPESLLYRAGRVPASLNRLKAVAKTAQKLPAKEVFVMDSGMAAILGACMDAEAQRKKNKLVLDIATSHTVGASVQGRELFGFFEYHTRDIDTRTIETLLKQLADGNLEHRKVLEQGGHGAYVRKHFDFENNEIIVATGPRRRLFSDTGLAVRYGAPLGDNMMTGTVGLLEAIRRQKKMPPIQYS